MIKKTGIILSTVIVSLISMSFLLNTTSGSKENDCINFCSGYADAKVPNRKGDEQLEKWREIYKACVKARKCKQSQKKVQDTVK